MVFLIILLAIIVVLVVANIKIVPQAHAYVIERLGAYSTTWSVGLHIRHLHRQLWDELEPGKYKNLCNR